MRKYITVVWGFAILFAFSGCDAPAAAGQGSDAPVTAAEPINSVLRIIDRTVTEELGTADALEPFWSDGTDVYVFSGIKSRYVIVEYADGTQKTITEALAAGDVTVDDLHESGIVFFVEPLLGESEE